MKKLAGETQEKKEFDVVNMFAENGIVADRDFLTILSQELDIPPIDMSRVVLDEEVMGMVSEKLARRHSVIPLSRIGDDITLVVSNPTDIVAIDDIKTVTGCNVELVLATRRDLQDALKSFYETEETDIKL